MYTLLADVLQSAKKTVRNCLFCDVHLLSKVLQRSGVRIDCCKRSYEHDQYSAINKSWQSLY